MAGNTHILLTVQPVNGSLLATPGNSAALPPLSTGSLPYSPGLRATGRESTFNPRGSTLCGRFLHAEL